MELAERSETVDDGYVIEDGGLRVLRQITNEEWTKIGERIVRRLESGRWALGDWLLYGGRQEHLGERWVGSSYETARRITGYSTSYLSRCYTLAATYPRGVRVPSLTWSHHNRALTIAGDPVTSLRLLAHAAEQHWTVDELDAHAGKVVVEVVEPKASLERKDYIHREVICPKCQHRFPMRGNKAKRSAA